MMFHEEIHTDTIRKYNQPLPRYTSYPTVPFWKEGIDREAWMKMFAEQFSLQNHTRGISLYLHLPFCESLCTYCGCNKKITTNHAVEEEYGAVLEQEWKIYRKLMKQTPVIRELHLGGGTPTFFSPRNLQKLVQFILKSSIIHPQREFSIEGHPNNTTEEHLKVLYGLGFRRISYGVQDNDPEVQRVINRIQPLENVKNATETARRNGFTSVNFDLIYGLPLQTVESMRKTMEEVVALKPDRIAFYSYAHVPWTSRAQRLFDERHLPDAEEKLQLYLTGKELLLSSGYQDIGMDHFALPHDELYRAWKSGRLHRNFMGYTTQNSGMLVGLGVSSISDIGTAYAQNHKALQEYYAAVQKGSLAVHKGYFLTEEDQGFRKYILEISCRGKATFRPEHLPLLEQYTFPLLDTFVTDDLVTYDRKGIQLTGKGHQFVRNVCSAFDLHLQRNRTLLEKPLFSQAI